MNPIENYVKLFGEVSNYTEQLTGIPLVDAHCHVPWPDPPKEMQKSYDLQYRDFINSGGKFMVTSAVDLKSLEVMRRFTQKYEHSFLSAGLAPQTKARGSCRPGLQNRRSGCLQSRARIRSGRYPAQRVRPGAGRKNTSARTSPDHVP